MALMVVLPLFSENNSKNINRTKYNFLLITIDTLRPDRLSCYSSEHLRTPRIDGLAGRGIVFTRAFAHTPSTLPSHANILLGTTPLYHGVHDNSNFIVREEFLTLAEYLKSFGYSTGAFVGAFPLDSRFGLTQGFDVYDDNYGYKDSQEFTYVERKAEIVVEKSINWLRTERNPWFLWIHLFDPHQRYYPPQPFRHQYKGKLYDGEVAYVDFALGKLFDYLEKNKLFDDTLVVFTGDHGESLGEHGEPTHGYFAYNSTLWVPLIISFPGMKPGKVDQGVGHADIFPTVCDVLEIEKPPFLQGVSLLPALRGKTLPRRVIYFESLYPYYSRGWAPLRGFIEGSQKFIDSPIPELYDLKKDFEESENLAPQENLLKHQKKLEELIKSLSFADKSAKRKEIDQETIRKLRSLGYVSSPQILEKKSFSENDDLKVLLPYRIKLMGAVKAYHRQNFEKGISLLKEILAERKDFDLAYAYLATLYKEQRKMKEAVEVLRQGLKNNPSSYKVISTLGIMLVEAGHYDEAIEVLKKGLASIDFDPELWNYLGMAYWSKKNFKDAHDAYQKVLALDKNYPFVFNNLGTLYLSQFLKSKKASDIEKAIWNFKKAIELDPDYASAYNGLGSAYGQVGDIDAAIGCWEKAVELKPDFAFPLYNLGLSYLAKKEKTKALGFFHRYKKVKYRDLSAEEKQKLDVLIQKSQ
ncbi:MAG: sulfatase-like hydrolase/transferase [Candidatus Aminicenantes bacterium]|nr:sulfatase-like hydrolase/transferase [Candidatus Aminicenantes bacterium]